MNKPFLILFALLLPLVRGAEIKKPKPNIVLILTDDLGWQDVKCYDIDAPSPVETPNIDALAKKGVKFCRPTRRLRPVPRRGAPS